MPESRRHHKHEIKDEEQHERQDHSPTEQAAQENDLAADQTAPVMDEAVPEGTSAVEKDLEPTEDPVALHQQIDECRAQANSYFEGWQRERADFSNYRKRVERDQAQTYQNATGSVVKRFLVISDDLARALKNQPAEGEAAAWANGIDLIYRKLQQLLEAEGVHKMDTAGETFDPNRHEAISHEDSPDHGSGQIIEVVQDGYLIGDRVLRPALVRVAR